MGVDAEDRMEIRVEEVVGLIEGVRCGYCKDRLTASLERVVSGDQPGGLYLTKHARLYLHRTAKKASSGQGGVRPEDGGCRGEGKWRETVLKLSNGLGVEHIQQLQEQITAMCEPEPSSAKPGSTQGGQEELESASDTDDRSTHAASASASGKGGDTDSEDWSESELAFPEREGYQSLSSDEEDDMDSLAGITSGPWQSELASLFEGVHDFATRAQELGQTIQASLLLNSPPASSSSENRQLTLREGEAERDLLHDPDDRLAALDWNPKFAHLLSNADTVLNQWMRQITSVLLYLSRLDLLAFLSSKNDRREIRKLVEELWSGYEQALERLLNEATSSRREQLRDGGANGAGGQPTVVAFCFAARNRQQLAKLIQKKQAIMEELHNMLIARCHDRQVQSLFRRLSRVKQSYEKRLFTPEWCDLDAREDSALYQRLQFFSDNSFVATRNDLMAQEQQSDSQLKKAIADWDTMLERVRDETVARSRRELAPTVYPQTLRLQRRVQAWLRRFDREWEELHQAQQLKAKLSQQEVTRLQSQLHTTRQQLKNAKEAAALTAKKRRKEEMAMALARGEEGIGERNLTSNTLNRAAFQNFGLMLLGEDEDGATGGTGDEGDERTSMLATLCLMTNQRQLEHCLRFRLFAARNAFQRHRLCREFFAQYRWRVMEKDRQITKLCGGEKEAAHRLRALVACHLLSRLDRACGRHTAERYERQLVEAAEREDQAAQRHAKRKTRRKEQKAAQQLALQQQQQQQLQQKQQRQQSQRQREQTNREGGATGSGEKQEQGKGPAKAKGKGKDGGHNTTPAKDRLQHHKAADGLASSSSSDKTASDASNCDMNSSTSSDNDSDTDSNNLSAGGKEEEERGEGSLGQASLDSLSVSAKVEGDKGVLPIAPADTTPSKARSQKGVAKANPSNADIGGSGDQQALSDHSATAHVGKDEDEGWSVVGSKSKNRSPAKQLKAMRRESKHGPKADSPPSEKSKASPEGTPKAPGSQPPQESGTVSEPKAKGGPEDGDASLPARDLVGRARAGTGDPQGSARTPPAQRARGVSGPASSQAQQQHGVFDDKTAPRKLGPQHQAPTCKRTPQARPKPPNPGSRSRETSSSSLPSSVGGPQPAGESPQTPSPTTGMGVPHISPASAWAKPLNQPAGLWSQGPSGTNSSAPQQKPEEVAEEGGEAALETPELKIAATPANKPVEALSGPQDTTEQSKGKGITTEGKAVVEEEETTKVTTVTELRQSGQLQGGVLVIGEPPQTAIAQAGRDRAQRELAEKKAAEIQECSGPDIPPPQNQDSSAKAAHSLDTAKTTTKQQVSNALTTDAVVNPAPASSEKIPAAKTSPPIVEVGIPQPQPEVHASAGTWSQAKAMEEGQASSLYDNSKVQKVPEEHPDTKEEETFVIQFGGFGLESSDEDEGTETPTTQEVLITKPEKDAQYAPSPEVNAANLRLEVPDLQTKHGCGQAGEEKPRPVTSAAPDPSSTKVQQQPTATKPEQNQSSCSTRSSRPPSQRGSTPQSPQLAPPIPPPYPPQVVIPQQGQGQPMASGAAGVTSPGVGGVSVAPSPAGVLSVAPSPTSPNQSLGQTPGSLLQLPAPMAPLPHPPPGATMMPVPAMVGTVPQGFMQPNYPQAGIPQPVQYTQLGGPGRGATSLGGPQGYLTAQQLRVAQQAQAQNTGASHPHQPHYPPQPHSHLQQSGVGPNMGHPQHQHHPGAGPNPPHAFNPQNMQFRPSAAEWVPQGYPASGPPSSFSNPQALYMQQHAQGAQAHQAQAAQQAVQAQQAAQAQLLQLQQYYAYLSASQHHAQQQQLPGGGAGTGPGGNGPPPPHPPPHMGAPGPVPAPHPPPQLSQTPGQGSHPPAYVSVDSHYYQSPHHPMYHQQSPRVRYPSHDYESPEKHGGRRRFSSGTHHPLGGPSGQPRPYSMGQQHQQPHPAVTANQGAPTVTAAAAQPQQQQQLSNPAQQQQPALSPGASIAQAPSAAGEQSAAAALSPDQAATVKAKSSDLKLQLEDRTVADKGSAHKKTEASSPLSAEESKENIPMELQAATQIKAVAQPPLSTLEKDTEGVPKESCPSMEVSTAVTQEGVPSPEALQIPTIAGSSSSMTDNTLSNESPTQRGFPRGLANATGQNNCFLNVVVQSLWHLDAFRDRFWQAAHSRPTLSSSQPEEGNESKPLPHKEEDSERICQALTAIFIGLSGQSMPEEAKAEGDDTVVSVDTLRKALSQTSAASAQLFGAGRMDDAVEALEVVLGSLPADLQGIVQETFCMTIEEVLECPKCGGLSPQPPNSYGTNTFYVPVKSLQEIHANNPDASFSTLLKLSGRGDLYQCLNPACTIHRRQDYLPSERRLAPTGAPPRVFSLGFVWESLQLSPESIAKVLASFECTLDLNVVLSADPTKVTGPETAQIRGFFCFQAHKHHYVAFFYNSELGQWFIYDDATIQQVGSNYSHVIDICARALLQPLIVFFEVVKYYRNLQLMEPLNKEYSLGQSPLRIGKEEKVSTSKISKGQQNNLSLNSLVTSSRRRHKNTGRKKGSGK